jgi:vacuolar-type H+-ATPase subunit I/STV1
VPIDEVKKQKSSIEAWERGREIIADHQSKGQRALSQKIDQIYDALTEIRKELKDLKDGIQDALLNLLVQALTTQNQVVLKVADASTKS